MIKIICDKCGREVYMKNPDLTGRAKIGYEEYDLCKYCILDIKRFINQGKADRKAEPRKEQNFCGKCRYLYRDFKYGLSCYRLMDNEPCEYEERKDEPQTEENEIPEYEPWRDAFDSMDCCSREVEDDHHDDID